MFIHISTADFTVVFTGPFGVGKSAACNFFMGKEVFESRPSFMTVTKKVASCVATIEGKHVKLVDTPGLLDPSSIKDEECLEFAKGLISIQYGFHAIGVVLNLNANIENDAASLFKNLLNIYNDYLPYIFLMFTHGKDFGQTDRQQNLAIKKMVKGQPKDSKLSQILESINCHYLIIESVENMKKGYHTYKSKELLNIVEAIFRQTGTVTNNRFALSIAQTFKVSQNVFETKLTQCIRVAVEEFKTYEKNEKAKEKTCDAKEDEAKTKKQTTQATNISSLEEANNSKSEEKSNSKSKEFYGFLESVVDRAMSQGKSLTFTKHEDDVIVNISS